MKKEDEKQLSNIFLEIQHGVMTNTEIMGEAWRLG